MKESNSLQKANVQLMKTLLRYNLSGKDEAINFIREFADMLQLGIEITETPCQTNNERRNLDTRKLNCA